MRIHDKVELIAVLGLAAREPASQVRVSKEARIALSVQIVLQAGSLYQIVRE